MKLMRQRKFAALILIAVLTLTGFTLNHAPRAEAQTPGGRVRFVHAVPGVAAVDVIVDQATAASGLDFANTTRYLNVAAGDHTITVNLAGKAVFQGKIKVTPDPTQALTVVIQGTASAVAVGVYPDDLSPTDTGKIRFTAIHAISDAPALDILKIEGSPLIQGLKYGEPHGSFDIPALSQGFAIVAAGGDVSGALAKTPALSMVAGTSNMLVVIGTADKASYLLLNAPTDADKPADTEWVGFVHAGKDVPAVDVYLGSTLIVPNLKFGDTTPHIGLGAGAGVISLRTAGSKADSTVLATANMTLTGGKAATVVIAGSATAPVASVTDDNIAKLDPNTARVQVINAADSGSATVTFSGGSAPNKVVADAGKPAPAPIEIAALNYDVSASADQNVSQVTNKLALSGGVLYDVVIVGGDNSLLVATTGLSEQPGSVPGQAAVVAAATSVATEAAVAVVPTTTVQAATTVPPTQAAAATSAATVANPTQPVQIVTVVVVVTATPASGSAATTVPPTDANAATTAPAAPTTAAPTSAPATATSGITGVVNTNPGVNLKIREHPNQNATTLALVPSGETVTINGVQGPIASAASGTGTKTPTLTLTPTNTATPTGTFTPGPVVVPPLWVYITWKTPDGGTVTGWVDAHYLTITNNGKSVFRDSDILAFKKIPEDTTGAINSAAVTPVSNAIVITGTVTNVDANVNVQIRRQPDITSESLGLLPAGATVTVINKTDVKATPVVGAPASPTWLFIKYDGNGGGSIYGWVNSQYFKLTRNNQPYDLALVPVATTITAGYVQGTVNTGATTPPQGLVGTVVNIDPGANVQLRQQDNQNATSLGLIPAGTQLQVLGRNGDGTWIQVSYNSQTGWVNANYLSITKNGKLAKITDLKNTSGEPDIALTPGAVNTTTTPGAAKPTSTPTATATAH